MTRTHAELSALNEMSRELSEHVAARPAPHPDFSDVQQTRLSRTEHLDSLRHLLPIPAAIPDVVNERDVFVSADDGYQIRVRVYTPTKPTQKAYPVIVLYHEGGWCLGDLSDEEMNARMFVRDIGAVCVNVEYRLAPEHPFPVGINDCYSVLKTVATKPEMFSDLADPKLGLVLGGSSAGGNIAAVLAHRAREDKLVPSVTGQWLSCAFLTTEKMVPEKYREQYISRDENVNDPIFTDLKSESQAAIMDLVGVKAPDDPLFVVFAPTLYPPSDGEGKPPLAKAWINVAGMDPLRDDGLIYDQALREEWGTKTRLDLYPGYGHMFWMNWPEMEESQKFWKTMIDGMRWLLEKEAST